MTESDDRRRTVERSIECINRARQLQQSAQDRALRIEALRLRIDEMRQRMEAFDSRMAERSDTDAASRRTRA